jgi:hypothetical protein
MSGGGSLAHRRADHPGHDLAQCLAMAQAEQVGFTDGLLDLGIAHGGAFVGPEEHVLQQINAVRFLDPENAVRVGVMRDVHERDR